MSNEDGSSTCRKQIEQLSKKHNADIWLYEGVIDRGAAYTLINGRHKQFHQNAVLILCTYGGDPDAAYKIVKYFHRKYQTLKLIVFGPCKSAGSLIALGADALIMGPDGELGPLDIQQGKNDELGGLTSGLNIPIAIDTLVMRALAAFRECLLDIRESSKQQITTKTAADIAVNLSVGLYSKILEKVDPNALGEIQRAIQISNAYALRIQKENLKDGCIQNLVYYYPSHSFVIDYEEAQKLFKIVEEFKEVENEFFNNFSLLIKELDRKNCYLQRKMDKTYIANLNEVYYEREQDDESARIYEDSNRNGKAANTKHNGEIERSGKREKQEVTTSN